MSKLFSVTGQKRPRPRRTQRQKLRDAVGLAREALSVHSGAPASMWPDEGASKLFADFSEALCALVVHHLAAPEWEVEVDRWRWDGHRREFCFDYGGRCELPRSDRPRDNDLLWCRARMTLDPKVDLDAELTRLGALAAHYRERVEFLERETLRDRLRAIGDGVRS